MTTLLIQAGEPLPWQITNRPLRHAELVSASIVHNNKPLPLNEMQGLALRAYIELLRLKNYNTNTISVCRNWFILFLNCFLNHKPSSITKNEIMDMLVRFRNSEKWSA